MLEAGLTAGMMLRLQAPSNQNPFLCGLGPQAALQASRSCTRLTARDDVQLLPLPLAPPLSAATLCPDAVAATTTREAIKVPGGAHEDYRKTAFCPRPPASRPSTPESVSDLESQELEKELSSGTQHPLSVPTSHLHVHHSPKPILRVKPSDLQLP